jgi:NADP-dependent 3-hydroxy acid dehydrogenase YdfG
MAGLLAGARLLVVGATSGVGRGVAQETAQRGARVAAAGRRKERLLEVIEASGGRTTGIVADVRIASTAGCSSSRPSTLLEVSMQRLPSSSHPE